MRKIKIKYQIKKYNVQTEKYEYIKSKIKVLNKILFLDMINIIIEKHKIKYIEIDIEEFSEKIWEKFLGKDFFETKTNNIINYKNFNYQLKNLQKMFNVFNKRINIIIDSGGRGRLGGTYKGIKFYINPKEYDKHKYEPHIHCKYQNEEMRIRLDTLKIMKNDQPFRNPTKVKYAKKWLKENQKDMLKLYIKLNKIKNNDIKLEIDI